MTSLGTLPTVSSLDSAKPCFVLFRHSSPRQQERAESAGHEQECNPPSESDLANTNLSIFKDIQKMTLPTVGYPISP
jgi:hypothetical protein